MLPCTRGLQGKESLKLVNETNRGEVVTLIYHLQLLHRVCLLQLHLHLHHPLLLLQLRVVRCVAAAAVVVVRNYSDGRHRVISFSSAPAACVSNVWVRLYRMTWMSNSPACGWAVADDQSTYCCRRRRRHQHRMRRRTSHAVNCVSLRFLATFQSCCDATRLSYA